MMRSVVGPAGLVRVAALGCVLGLGCGGGGFDARRLVTTCGLDCAADEVRYRLASSPRDRDLYVALAEIEEQRGRPGAALEALDAAEKLGRAFRGGLGGADRARLGRLLVARARQRVTHGRPGGDADLARARGLGVKLDAGLTRDAATIAIAHDLRHVDPVRRARGRARLTVVDPVRAAALDGRGTPAEIAAAAAWLDQARARRVLREMLDEAVRAHGVAAFAATPGALDRWLAARRWWGGHDARPDLVTLERAEAAGAGPCWFPRAGNGCDPRAAARAPEPEGATWEPQLVTWWERDGIRATDRDTALAWLLVARRAADRGQLESWDRAVRDHVDVTSLADDPRLPPWARYSVHRLAGREPGELLASPVAGAPGQVVDGERSGGLTRIWDQPSEGRPWSELAAALAAPRRPLAPAGLVVGRPRALDEDAGPPPPGLIDRLALIDIANAYVVDPALADRKVADTLARAADAAAVAPVAARLFTLLGDPPRARALWQRALDASPEDAELALGLAIAMADAADPAAGLQMMIRAAAGWGDAGEAMLRGARGFAAAGHTVEALTLVKSAMELSAPGDEAPAAALAARLLDELGRGADAAALRALAPTPSAWDGADRRAAVEQAAAVLETAGPGTPARTRALARLAYLVESGDALAAGLATAVLRGWLAAADGTASSSSSAAGPGRPRAPPATPDPDPHF